MTVLVYCLIALLSLLFIWVFCNQFFMPRLSHQPVIEEKPLVSILVPMRDEETNVVDLIQNLSALTYPNVECIFLDDQSTDLTGELIRQESNHLSTVRLMTGKDLPAGWVGKVHACHQLSQQAKGAYLLFLDADVRLAPDTIEQSIALMKNQGSGLLTGFPRFPVTGLLAKLLVPMQHVLIYLHLPLYLANRTSHVTASAAHGSFMLFETMTYRSIGGHKSVKHSLVEDVHLARAIKKSGAKACLANVTDHVTCYMYHRNRDVWQGFSKNAFPGIGRSYLLAVCIICLYSVLFISPLVLAGLAFTHAWYYALPLLISLGIRFLIDQLANQRNWIWLLMPFSAIAFILILMRSMALAWSKSGFTWKGRTYS
ncbi:glycosyltransferase [Alkalihalobacillus sp. NPDC078783]